MTGSPHLEWNRGNRQRSTSNDDGLIQVEHRVAGIGAAKLVFEPDVMDAAGRQLMEATRGEAEHAAIAIEGLSAALQADSVAIDREGRVREVVDEEPDRVALDAIDDDSNLPGQLGALGSRGERGRAGGEGEEKQQGQGEEESADESLEAAEVDHCPRRVRARDAPREPFDPREDQVLDGALRVLGACAPKEFEDAIAHVPETTLAMADIRSREHLRAVFLRRQ